MHMASRYPVNPASTPTTPSAPTETWAGDGRRDGRDQGGVDVCRRRMQVSVPVVLGMFWDVAAPEDTRRVALYGIGASPSCAPPRGGRSAACINRIEGLRSVGRQVEGRESARRSEAIIIQMPGWAGSSGQEATQPAAAHPAAQLDRVRQPEQAGALQLVQHVEPRRKSRCTRGTPLAVPVRHAGQRAPGVPKLIDSTGPGGEQRLPLRLAARRHDRRFVLEAGFSTEMGSVVRGRDRRPDVECYD